MADLYTDDELEKLVAKLKTWSTYPIKELAELTNLSRVTVSKWMHNREKVSVNNRMLLWQAALDLITDRKQNWKSQKHKTSKA